jgi:hypothetical protein
VRYPDPRNPLDYLRVLALLPVVVLPGGGANDWRRVPRRPVARMSKSLPQRIESDFHETIWGAANAFGRVEAAVTEARDIAHAILSDDVPEDVRRWMAQNWLDRFGHDPRKAKSS